jgi:ribonuclease R
MTDTEDIVGVIVLESKKLHGHTKKGLPIYSFIPLSNKHPPRFLVPSNSREKRNILAVIRLTRWEADIPFGTCVRVLGAADDRIIYDYALLLKNELLLSVKPLQSSISSDLVPVQVQVSPELEPELEPYNYKNITVIDPVGSTDRDDGFNITKEDSKPTYLYVHIADVDRYFPTNTLTDLALRERITSIYALNKVYHMLPEEYACNIISLTSSGNQLRPHYVLTTVFEITENGPVFKEVHQATVTISERRSFTYEQAQDMLDKKKDTQIQLLSEITGLTDTHKMIEKIMIWTNSAIAEFIYNRGYNFSVYYPPVPDSTLNLKLKLTSVFGGPRAIYSTTQHGHGMMGLKHYTHFTSPIRRYADIVVHRIVKHIISGNTDFNLDLDECCEKVNHVTQNAKNYYRNQNMLKLMDKLPKDGNPVITVGYIVQFLKPNYVSVYLKDYNIVLNTTLFSRELLDIITITEEGSMIHLQLKDGGANAESELSLNTEIVVSLVYLPSEIRLHKKISVTFPCIRNLFV